MRKTPLSSLLLLLFVLQLACKKENDRPQWDVAVKGPILKASLTLDNLIADSLQHTNPDGSLSIVFDSDVFKLDPDSLFKIPDTTLNTLNIWQFITYPVQPNTPFYSVNKVIIIYQIPKAIKNGLPFKVQEVIDSGSITNPTLFSGTYDLDGYLVDLTGATGNKFNTAYYDVQAISDPQGNAFDIHTGDTLINLNTTIMELIPEYGRGYLGQKTIHQSGN